MIHDVDAVSSCLIVSERAMMIPASTGVHAFERAYTAGRATAVARLSLHLLEPVSVGMSRDRGKSLFRLIRYDGFSFFMDTWSLFRPLFLNGFCPSIDVFC